MMVGTSSLEGGIGGEGRRFGARESTVSRRCKREQDRLDLADFDGSDTLSRGSAGERCSGGAEREDIVARRRAFREGPAEQADAGPQLIRILP